MSTVNTRAATIVNAVRLDAGAAVADILHGLDADELQALIVHLARHVDLTKVHAADAATRQHDLVISATSIAARRFKVDQIEVMSTDRRQEVVDARHVACYALRLAGGMSYPLIGRCLGRDHTSVMYAVSRVGQTPRLRRIATDIAVELGWERDIDEEAS